VRHAHHGRVAQVGVLQQLALDLGRVDVDAPLMSMSLRRPAM